MLLAAIAIAAIGGVVAYVIASHGHDSVAEPTTTEASLADRTTDLGAQVTAILCPEEDCVDATEPGVLTIDSKPTDSEYADPLFDGDALETVGKETGLWSIADSKRMVETRALDGTQHSVNGAITWTYHPDHGIEIVVDLTATSGHN